MMINEFKGIFLEVTLRDVQTKRRILSRISGTPKLADIKIHERVRQTNACGARPVHTNVDRLEFVRNESDFEPSEHN